MKWLIALAVVLVAVLAVKHFTGCNCDKGKGWLGKMGMWKDPIDPVKEKFVAGQEKG